MGIEIPGWEIAHDPLGDRPGGRAALRKARRRCSPSPSWSMVAQVVGAARLVGVLDIATGLGEIGVAQRHSRAAVDCPASGTRAQSAGSARREGRQGESEVDADDTAEVAHWGNRSSCWARCRPDTAAVASETGRCTVERPTWWPRSPGRIGRVEDWNQAWLK